MEQSLPPQLDADVCGFRHHADKFTDTHFVGDEFSPMSLRHMDRFAGNTEKGGKWPHEIRRVHCGTCTGCLILQIEFDQISSMAWTGNECAVKASAVERARLAAEEAANPKKTKLL